MKFFLMFILITILIIVGPYLTIWSLNTLFHTNIDFTLETWAAIIVIQASIRGLFLKN
jgi:hypothetical protein